jgi:MFS family permease
MVLVGSVFVFGTACLASAFSGDLVQLIIWRFITGLGLGAAMPNAVTGLSQGTAAVITALFALGGVWAILSGWLMDRFSANLTVAICFALTALGVWSIGQTGSHVALLASLVLIAGVLLNTAQTSLPSLAAAFYPTQGRATWRLDASAALPALLLSLNWHVATSRLERSSREWQFPGSSPGERCW